MWCKDGGAGEVNMVVPSVVNQDEQDKAAQVVGPNTGGGYVNQNA